MSDVSKKKGGKREEHDPFVLRERGRVAVLQLIVVFFELFFEMRFFREKKFFSFSSCLRHSEFLFCFCSVMFMIVSSAFNSVTDSVFFFFFFDRERELFIWQAFPYFAIEHTSLLPCTT